LNYLRVILVIPLNCFLALAFLGVCELRPQTNAAPISPTQGQVPKELEVTVQKFLNILEKGQPADMLSMVSKTGVAFGIDSDPIPFLQIQSQFRQKKGVYCFLFDTDCLRNEELQEWKKAYHTGNIKAIISLREAIRFASSRKVHISAEGSVTWNLKLEGSPAEDEINEMIFGFALEQNTWKLTGVSYP
jgi:hypothetical protein